MKKNNYLAVISLFAFFMFACTQDEMILEKGDNQQKTEDVISKNPEIKAALELINEFRKTPNPVTKALQLPQNEVKVLSVTQKTQFIEDAGSIQTRSTQKDSVNIFTFIIEVNNYQGYIIAASDQRMPTIFAYVEKGNLEDTLKIGGLREFLSYIPDICKEELSQYYQDTTYVSKKDKSNVISTMDDVLNISSINVAADYYIQTPSGANFVPIWGQDAPYNNNCPPCVWGGNCPTGCVATALAIFCAAYDGRVTIPGYDLPTLRQQLTINTSSPYASSIASLMRKIGNEVNMIYACGGSESSLMGYGPGFLSSYGVRHEAIYGALNYSKAATELLKGNYILARGSNALDEGHAWIYQGIRGYGTISGSYESLRATISRLESVYCNWGWDGNSNGWFAYHTRPYQGQDFNGGPGHIFGRVRY